MKVKRSIYIISFNEYTAVRHGEEDFAQREATARNQVILSAQSYYYKYRSRRDEGVEIYWYAYLGGTFVKQVSFTEENSWKEIFEAGLVNPTEGTSASALLAGLPDNSPLQKQYKDGELLVDNGAVIVAHGSRDTRTKQYSIGGHSPESLADLLASDTKNAETDPYNKLHRQLPVFGKVVFNVCYTAKYEQQPDLVDWVVEKDRPEKLAAEFLTATRLHKKTRLEKDAPNPKHAKGTRYYLNPRAPLEQYDNEQYIVASEMNMLCRFLARYYKAVRPQQRVMVAGYDDYVTGRHPSKQQREKAEGFDIGKKHKATNINKRFYSATQQDGRIDLVKIEQQGWSDRA